MICDCCLMTLRRVKLTKSKSDYKYLQEWLSKRSENNPYKHAGCFNYETDYKEGIAAANSVLSEFYHMRENRIIQ